MGKSKKRSRASRARSNPLANNSSTRTGSKDEALVTKKIQPLLQNLQSVVQNDRSMALGSISVLCEDPHMRSLLLKQKLVHIVMSKLLTDENTEIVVESYGLLRNLSLEEGYDVSVHLWRSDIWTSINSGFDKLLESLGSLNGSDSKASSESKRLLFDFGDNLLSLLVALANGSDDILENIISTEKIARVFQVIVKILQYGFKVDESRKASLKIPSNLFNTVLDLIYDFSSESVDFIEAVSADTYLSEFIKNLPNIDLSNPNELTRVLIQGIYLQFLDMQVTNEQARSIISKTCIAIEQIDLQDMRHSLSNVALDQELASSANEEVASKIKDYTKKRVEAMMKLQSIEISLDLITAIAEIIASQFEENHKQVDEALLKILTVALPVIFQTLFSDFTSRVLIAWNNTLWLYLTLGINLFELPQEPWKQLWTAMNDTNKEFSQEEDFGVKLGKLGATWALLKTVQLQQDPQPYLQFFACGNESFIASVIAEYTNTSGLEETESLELKQRCCGILSSIATLRGHIELNRKVGQFFMEQLVSKDTPVSILIEITNSLFEIYPDASFDYDGPVFVQDGFLNILEGKVIPNLKRAFKLVDKNKNPELKAKSHDCFTTLDSFIHYKKNEHK